MSATPLPILILTAFSERELVDRATDLPIQGYLIKPIQPEELSAAITVAVKRFAESRAMADRAAKLESDLATRKLVDRAKGMLMQSGMTEEDAYRTIKERARRERRTLAAAAVSILSAIDRPTGKEETDRP